MIPHSQQRVEAGVLVADRPQHAIPHRGAYNYDWWALASSVIITGVNISAITGFRLPFIGPAAGFWFLIVLPVYLVSTTSVWRGSSAAERVGYSTAAVLLLLMLAGLTVNVLLPPLGFPHPLDPIPLVLVGDVLLVSLYLFRRKYSARISWRAQARTLGPEEIRLFVGAVLFVALAVLGANRLNNNAGDQLTLVALSGIVLTLFLLLRWQRQIRDGMISATLYMVGLALLLMTSLRGWYVTGHDIQVEYRVFQLAESHGHWSISYFRNAYNSCLSITILPTEIGRMVQVDSPYVYKVFFQVIFASCPVLVYTIARRYWSRTISILAAIYFLGFPTFFTDMPFLNRQEIAFIFVCVAILSITNSAWSRRWRRLALFVAAVGIELSHYSTMYVFFATLVVAWTAQNLSMLNPRRLRRPRDAAGRNAATWAVTGRTASIGSILLILGVIFVWGQLATQTVGHALTVAESAVSGFVESGGTRSADVSYGLLPGKTVSQQALLNDYRRQLLKERGSSPPSAYVSASSAVRYPTPVANEPILPLTRAGRLLSDTGVSSAQLNTVLREVAAKGEQVFAIVGLLVLLLAQGLRSRIGREMWFLCLGNLIILGMVTMIPNLTVDYGILRAFQESLILLAPVLVAGSLAIFSAFGRTWATRAAASVCIGIFVSTTGLLPQLTGGYPPQLGLNNEGLYYDSYYMHPQEVAAVAWLAGMPGTLPDGVQAPFAADRFAFTAPSDVNGEQFMTEIYPLQVRRSSWVILGYTAVRTGRVTFAYKSDLVTYSYPIGFLLDNKNVVYNNGGTVIYR